MRTFQSKQSLKYQDDLYLGLTVHAAKKGEGIDSYVVYSARVYQII